MKLYHLFNTSLLILLISCGGGGGGGSSDLDQVITINPVINTFTSSSSSISSGNAIDLTWTTSNTIACTASGDWSGSKSLSASETLTLSEVKSYTFTLTCSGENPQNTTSKSLSVEVTSSSGSSSDIYAEDKSSYCATPNNDSSSYWLEDFTSNVLDENIFTYQESNGFCVTPGCPNGDSDFIQGWGNNVKETWNELSGYIMPA